MAEGFQVPWPQAHPPAAHQTDPFTAMHSIASTSHLLQQNALIGRNMAAQQAIGEAFQQSVGPDGAVDYAKAESLLAGNPAAGPLLPAIMNQIEQRKLTQVQVQKERLDMGIKQIDHVNQRIGALVEKGDNVTHDDLVSGAGQLLGDLISAGQTEGYANPAYMAKAITNAPRDSAGLAKWLKGVQQSGMSAKEQAETLRWHIQQIQSGNRTELIRAQPYSGKSELMGSTPMGATPGEANALVEREARPGEILPDGSIAQGKEPVKQPRGTIAPMVGGGTYAPAGGGAQGAPGGIPAPGGNARAGGATTPLPMAGDIPMRPTQGATGGPENAIGDGGTRPTARPGPGGAFVAGPGGAQSAAAGQGGLDVQAHIKDLAERVSTGGALMQRQDEMRKLMQEIRLGGGSETWKDLAKKAQAMGAPTKLVDYISGGNTGSAEEFGKFAIQNATQVLRQIMVGSRMTNMEFETFRNNNPSLSTDPRAVENIFNYATKVLKADKAELQAYNAFRKSGGDPQSWGSIWADEAVKRGLWTLHETQGGYKGAPQPQAGAAGRKSPEDILKQWMEGTGAR